MAVKPLASNVLPVIDDPETQTEYPPLPPFLVNLQVLLPTTTRPGVSPPKGPISKQKLFPARMVLFTTFVPLTDCEATVEWKPMACAAGAPKNSSTQFPSTVVSIVFFSPNIPARPPVPAVI